MALHITDANFKEVLANNAVVVVDFGAAWCGPCKSLQPVIDKIATAYEGRAAVGKVDIEESPETTEEFAKPDFVPTTFNVVVESILIPVEATYLLLEELGSVPSVV